MQNKYDNKNIIFSPHILLKGETNTYVYNGITGGLYKIDNEYEKVLLKENGILSLNEKKLISLMDSKFVIDKAIIEKKNNFKVSIFAITMIINNFCNLNCGYCYETDKKHIEMTYDDAVKVIDLFIKKNFEDSITFAFFGGEPLLSFGLIKKIVEYIEFVKKNYNVKVHYALTTNATLITTDIAEFLIHHKFHITASLDGPKIVNDLHRVDINSNGSYDRAIRGIRKLSPIFPIIRATITKENNDLVEIISHFKDEYVQYVYCAPAYSNFITEKDYELLTDRYLALIDYFKLELKEKHYSNCLKCYNILSVLKRIHRPSARYSYCDSCLHSISIDSTLKIYPCHRYSSNQKNIICNVCDKDLFEKIEEKYNTFFCIRDTECLFCWAKLLCGGGCIYENGNIPINKKYYCKFIKVYFHAIINLYLDLSKSDKMKLFL